MFRPLLALLGLAATAAGQALAPPVSLGRVDLQGLETVEAAYVRRAIGATRGMTLTTEVLEADLRALRSTGLFHQVEARIEPLPAGTARLVFRLAEAPEVQEVRIEGARLLDAAALRETLRPRLDAFPSAEDLAWISRQVEARYQQAGLYACGLRAREPVTLDPEGVLTVHLSEPVLGELRIRGNRKVPTHHIRRQLLLPRGKVLRTERMQASVQRLARLGTIRAAAFQVEALDPEEEEVTLLLEVTEEPLLGELDYGLRYERVNGAVAALSLSRKNIFSTGATLRLDSEIGTRESYSLRLLQDWFLDVPVSAELGFKRVETRREARQGRTVLSRIEERRTGPFVRLSKTLESGLRVSVGVRDEVVRAEALDSFTLPANLVAIGGGSPVLAEYDHQAFSLGFSEGPEFFPLDAANPRAWRLDFEFSGGALLVSPGDYTVVRAEARRLRRLSRRLELAARLQAGTIELREGTLPFLELLTVGGSESLRGLDFKELAGDRQLLANLELRRGLGSRVDGVLFADWGDAWLHSQRNFDPTLAYGLGFRVDVKLFQLRIDLGHAVGRDGLEAYVGVGHLF